MKEIAISFEQFYKQHYTSFCFFANRYLKDTMAAEAIVGEVALKVWQKKEDLENPAALKSYFYSATRNACLNHIDNEKRKAARKAKYASTMELQEPPYIENIIRSETLARLEKAVHTLPVQCRKVFIKLFFEGKTLRQTAGEMNLSLSTIKNQRLRGIKLLRSQLTATATVVFAMLTFSF